MSLKKNLDAVVFERLREKIIRGSWTPGQALSADEISEHYGVSKTPVLLAMKRMEALRMLTVTPTGHYFVPEFSEKEIYDLIEIRVLLERQAITDIFEKNLPLDFELLKQHVQACSVANKLGDVVNARKADLALHMCLVSSADNSYMTDLYDRLQGQFMVANYLIAAHSQTEQEIASDDHEKMLEELQKGDWAAAIAVMEKHVYGARDKMIRNMRVNQTA